MIEGNPARWLLPAVALALLVVPSELRAQESASGAVILDTSGFWRVHYTLKPPVVKQADGVQVVKVPAKWLMSETAAPSADWTKPGFDDGAWSRFPGVAVGIYSVWGGPYKGRKVPFLARECMRGKFKVESPAKVKALSFSATYRGGIVVYLNGREVARGHVPKGGPPQLAEAYGDGEGHDRSLATVSIPAGALKKGVNVRAVDAVRAPYGEKDVKTAKRGRKVAN